MKAGKIRILALAALTLIAVGVWSIPYFTQARKPTNHRDNLQLCVQNADGTPASAEALAKIKQAFKDKVETHQHFKAAKLDRGNGPTFTSGCPGEATITSKNWAGPKYGAANLTAAPSEVSTFIFIVSQAEAQRAFGDVYPRITAQEMMCRGDVCGDTTMAVYITPEDLDNKDLLGRQLSWSVGLIPDGEQPSIQPVPTAQPGTVQPTATPDGAPERIPLTPIPAYPAP